MLAYRYERRKSHSEVQRIVLTRYFTYQVWYEIVRFRIMARSLLCTGHATLTIFYLVVDTKVARKLMCSVQAEFESLRKQRAFFLAQNFKGLPGKIVGWFKPRITG